MKLKAKRLFLLDMDGTIYLGNRLFSGVPEFLDRVKSKGGKYIFMTNNSSRSVSSYIDKLKSLGIEAVREDFVTSVDATVEFIKRRHGEEAFLKKIYVMGTESFIEQMREAGFNTVSCIDGGADIVLCGFDKELTYKKLEDVCWLLSDSKNEPEYLATNPDWVCPTEFGYVPDCGSMCEMIKKATGKSPYFIGKPNPDMALLAMKKTGFSREETLVIGDRIYTDIACGANAKVDTCFVLSGEGTLEDVQSADTKPTYIVNDIAELLGRIEDET